mmetsp:Transcript_47773/g.72235  ORF Transcript_47773/g.72235 Transcript_47773/m.72235 type:complete len:374 (-) Transcript_47773:111-1232(-)
MSVKPTFDTVTNKVVPNLQNTLGISNFRIYNANEEAEYIATLIKENNDITFIVDTGYLWYRESERVVLADLTSDIVTRYLNDYINDVGEKVKAVNGDEYEWLDNVQQVFYFNEPYIEYYYHWGHKAYPDVKDYSNDVARVGGFVQEFFNTYKDGKYKTVISVGPVFSTAYTEGLTDILLTHGLQMQAGAGAPLRFNINLYACFPFQPGYKSFWPLYLLTQCLDGSFLETQVTGWKLFFASYSIEGINPDDITFTITETGWPTAGEPYASEYLAAQYYNSTITRMKDPTSALYGVDLYLFEALDEDLKHNMPVEAHWGLMDANGDIKEEIARYWPSLNNDTNVAENDTDMKKDKVENRDDSFSNASGNLRATYA